MFRGEVQPAYKIYPMDRGWRVLKYVRENVFERTGEAANWWYSRGEEAADNARKSDNVVVTYLWWCAWGGYKFAGISQFISAPVFVAIFMIVHSLVIGAMFLASASAILFLKTANKLYSFWYRSYYRCPNCHESMPVPVFDCPTCGTAHTRLWPSEYGVLHHTCNVCGVQQLPTLERNGRDALDRRCPHCSRQLLAEIGTLTNIHIPVVGGPMAGKSNLIVTATAALIERVKASGEADVSFPDRQHEVEFLAQQSLLKGGQALLKTVDVVPKAFNLKVVRPGDRVSKIVYLYDAAGEAYDAADATFAQNYYGFVSGLMLVVDPFTIPLFVTSLGAQLSSVLKLVRPSATSTMAVYGRMKEMLESTTRSDGGQFSQPLAVVVTKVDGLGLESRVGLKEAQLLRRRKPEMTSDAEAMDALVQEFLLQYGMGNFVREVNLRFAHVRYFSCSALGRMPDGLTASPFVPTRTGDPLFWLLDELGVLGGPHSNTSASHTSAASTRPAATS